MQQLEEVVGACDPPPAAQGGAGAAAAFHSPRGSLAWPDYLAGQPEKPVRVLIADDDAHMRRVIAQELMSDRRTDLVGQASSLREARRLVREHAFDVMLVDLNLGDGSGYDLIRYVKQERSNAEVVVISVLEGEEDALRAFDLGASGFLVKNSWFGSFVQAVLQVANGGASITPGLARRLLVKLDRRRGGPRSAEAREPAPGKLSEREREVLRLIANGFTSAEIATRLAISQMTVNTHVKNIYQKLHVRSRAQAVSRASTWGFL